MHQDFALFTTVTVALLVAFAGGAIARRLGAPTMIGYLVAGIVIGPFTPGFVGDSASINQLAEIGVIFMLFGVGLHFSLKDLWAVRQVALPGAFLQILLGTLAGFGLGMLWGWSVGASLVLGVAASIASTVVLLRSLTDRGLLNTLSGRVAVGWLVLEDLVTVVVLVLMPLLANANGGGSNLWLELGKAMFAASAFVAIMLFLGVRVMPWLLKKIALTRSRELFILAIVALALGTAFGASEYFGVSLALGAFLAGVVISESDVGHQVGAEVVPFRDVFSVLFFVSVGMLVNPVMIWHNIGQVLALTLLVVVGKVIINLALGLVLPTSAQTILIVAAGLSQIGEFSFLLGEAGVQLGILSNDQYGIILAAAVISIMLNPLMYRLIPVKGQWLKKIPGLWRRLDKSQPLPELAHEEMHGHVIIVGHGRVGKHIRRVIEQLGQPYLIVESDAVVASELHKAGQPVLFGDAANSEILTHTHPDRARVMAVTVSDEVSAELIVAATHQMAPDLPIIARAGTESGVQSLVLLGAHDVIHPELEGGLEILRHTLLTLDLSPAQTQQYIDAVRSDAYAAVGDVHHAHALDQLVTAMRGVEISWLPVEAESAMVGLSLKEANVRAKTGASVIALVRSGQVTPNPKSDTVFHGGDLVGVIGSPSEVAEATQLLAPVTAQDMVILGLDEEGFEKK